ncbi:MAG: helix-turn-helix transcriptional regulator [Deltaproteobacteria bacterium]|nr:helix-turn-helix transcriptional regulator [Deltaproteobacteria bacterium]MBW2072894.1 helix-turn-helix transcriptional regulator [Deltaproteobacteria bacterium]
MNLMVRSTDVRWRRELGGRIKNLVVIKGWTQSELARKSGITEGNLSKIINGEIATSAEVIYRIAEALGTTSSQLMGERKPIVLKKDYIPADMDQDLLELARERHKQGNPIPEEILLDLARMRFRGKKPGKSYYAYQADRRIKKRQQT